MYGNIVHTTVDMGRFPEAVAGIARVKERLAAMKGFRGGYWLQPNDGHGMTLTLWDDEADARAALLAIGNAPAPGVTIDRVETRAVIAQA